MEDHAAEGSNVSSAERVGLEECVQLLRGPSDERRFVGLLLATKLLPAGDELVLLSVYEAVGPVFISRLLRPLHSPQTSKNSNGDYQKAAAAAGLGLAVLAGLCRVSKLAVSADFVEKIPLLLKVVRAGGIDPAVQSDSSHTQSVETQSANDHAVCDALECLVHILAASKEGQAVALESGGLSAAAQVLKSGVASNPAWIAPAVKLLDLLLSEDQRSESLAEAPDAVVEAVPALAHVFRAAPQKALSGEQASQAIAGGAPAVHTDASERSNAALQLEALQVLLLFLPLPMPQAEAGASGLHKMAGAEGEGWAADVRVGLYNILVSRTGQHQRHSALRLAAAVLELAQPQWLFGPIQQAGAVASFFQVLAEILKVEVSLLLNDALSIMHANSNTAESSQQAVAEPIQASRLQPRAQKAPAAQPCVNRPSPAPPVTGTACETGPAHAAAPKNNHSNLSANSTATPSFGRSDPPQKSRDESTPNDMSSPTGSSSSTKRSSSKQAPESPHLEEVGPTKERQRVDGNTALAETRVTDVLPAVFSLMEGCLQALAADTQAAEDTQEGSRLDDQVAQRAMQALSEAFETVLQFLEVVCAEGLDQDSPWLLAAVRAVGSFMAEVPHAHASRLQALLAWLVRCQFGAALPFLLPGLMLCSQAGNEDLDLDQPASHKRWHETLLQTEVVSAVVQYVCTASSQTAAAVHRTSEDAAVGAQAELAAATSLLTTILAPQPNMQSSQVIDGKMLQMVKPAVTAHNSCVAAWQQSPGRSLDQSSGLAAAIGLQCALALSAAQVQVTSNSQAQALCWSAAEAQETFATVLWALSQYDEIPHAGSHSVTDGLQHMELNEGTSDMQDTEDTLDPWDAVLEAATTLVESKPACRQQACMHPWVKQCLQHDRTQCNMSLQMFLQACRG